MQLYIMDKVRKLGEPQILGLGEIIRYNNRPKIKYENVAEHSFYVAYTVLRICNMYNIDDVTKLKALEFAVVHDCAELHTGDMPYDTKTSNPELAALLKEAEFSELAKHMPEILQSYQQLCREEEQSTTASIIVKLADAVSVLQYTNQELQLGNNTRQMIIINEDAKERVSKLLTKLEENLGGSKNE